MFTTPTARILRFISTGNSISYATFGTCRPDCWVCANCPYNEYTTSSNSDTAIKCMDNVIFDITALKLTTLPAYRDFMKRHVELHI